MTRNPAAAAFTDSRVQPGARIPVCARQQTWMVTLVLATACAPAVGRVDTTRLTLAADSAVRTALTIEATLDPASFPELAVGVLPLHVIASDASLGPIGHGLAELLMSDLSRSAQVVIVDRLRIHAILREQGLVRAGVADPARAPRLGRIVGARHLVAGTVTALGSNDLRVDAHLARTEDAVLRTVEPGVTPIDRILEAEKALAFRIFDALGVTLTPAERAAVEQQPTRNIAALLAFSRGVQAEAELRFFDAQREYREAVRLDGSFVTPRQRLRELDLHFTAPAAAVIHSIDAINRPHLRAVSDITDPAFTASGSRAVLVIPIIVR